MDKPPGCTLEPTMTAPPLGPGSKLSDVLARYPATGAIFIQHGPLFEVQPGQPSPQYRELTIEQYAARHGLDLLVLLHQLNAEATAADAASRPPGQPSSGRARASRWGPPAAPLGYTGAYRELSGADIESEPVVARQSVHGPE